ncbi:MAG: hypothetical protein ABIG44_05500 [Planctomycetota bacterium]
MPAVLINIGPGANQTVVAAEAGRIHRLHRLLTAASAHLTPKSGSTALTPKLTAGDVSLDVVWNHEFPQTVAGESLVILNDDMITRACWVEYDTVDG